MVHAVNQVQGSASSLHQEQGLVFAGFTSESFRTALAGILSAWETPVHPRYGSVQLSDHLLKSMNRTSLLTRTFSKLGMGRRGTTQEIKQANKTIAADFLQKSLSHLAYKGEALSLDELENTANAFLATNNSDLPIDVLSMLNPAQVSQYIHKVAPLALKWFKDNLGTIKTAHQSIQENVQSLRNNGLLQEGSAFSKEAIELSVPPNSPLGPLFRSILNTELNAESFLTEDGTALQISGTYLQEQGPQWVSHELPRLAKNLESQIKHEVQQLHAQHQSLHMDWDDVISSKNLVQTLKRHFMNTQSDELAIHCPLFLEQLIQHTLQNPQYYGVSYQTKDKQFVELSGPRFKENGKQWRTRDLPKEIKAFENEVYAWVADVRKNLFSNADKPQSQDEFRANLIDKFTARHQLVKDYPQLLEAFADAAIQNTPSANEGQLFYRQNAESTSEPSFKGGYLKKGGQLKNTRVKTASGKVYELLNTLTKADSAELLRQHGMQKDKKTVLGQGGFGKVRLARDLDTGALVAVKKFRVKQETAKANQNASAQYPVSSPEQVSESEIKPFLSVAEKLKTSNVEQDSFLTMRDYAHVAIPKAASVAKQLKILLFSKPNTKAKEGSSANNQETGLVEKSYIFLDLANHGDGKSVLATLHQLRRKTPKAAQQRGIDLAVQYAKVVVDLHALGFTHRDVKPANFLHTKDPSTGVEQIKLSDFGGVRAFEDNQKDGSYTPSFAPPELTSNSPMARLNYDALAHDAFSFGVTLWKVREAAYGYGHELPLELELEDGSTAKVGDFDDTKHAGVTLPTGAKLKPLQLDNLIAKLLLKDPKARISVSDAYQELLDIQAALQTAQAEKLNSLGKSSTKH